MLRYLAKQPAWWAANDPAVTEYHVKLAEHLEKKNALDQLERALRLGRFLIRDELGRGGMGVVYRPLDLGLAKCGDNPTGTDGPLTGDGQALGTREYMPPEQWVNGATVTAAADLYALGATLFYLLAGRPPFEAESSFRLMNMHLSAAVPSVRTARPDVPASLDAVIQRMLAKNPAHRGTARELAWQLSRAMAASRTPDVVAVPIAPSHSSASVVRPPETRANARPSQPTLTGSQVGPLLREMVSEVGRFFGKPSTSVLDAPPTERLPALAAERGHTWWDGFRGRWVTVSASVMGFAGLVWMLS